MEPQQTAQEANMTMISSRLVLAVEEFARAASHPQTMVWLLQAPLGNTLHRHLLPATLACSAAGRMLYKGLFLQLQRRQLGVMVQPQGPGLQYANCHLD